MDAKIAHDYEVARRAWPSVELSLPTFAERIQALTDAGASGPLHTNDLYLAWACLGGSQAAIAAFERQMRGPMRAAIAKISPDLERDELYQSILVELMVGAEGRSPKLGQYQGRGPLRAWVRVVCARSALNKKTRAKPHERPAENPNRLPPEALCDAELDYLKSEYRAQFRDAFAEAVGSLELAERTLLRQSLVLRMTARELATVQGTHHTTIVRRLAKARGHVIESTRAILARRLEATPQELDSVMGLIASRVEVSLSRLLAEK